MNSFGIILHETCVVRKLGNGESCGKNVDYILIFCGQYLFCYLVVCWRQLSVSFLFCFLWHDTEANSRFDQQKHFNYGLNILASRISMTMGIPKWWEPQKPSLRFDELLHEGGLSRQISGTSEPTSFRKPMSVMTIYSKGTIKAGNWGWNGCTSAFPWILLKGESDNALLHRLLPYVILTERKKEKKNLVIWLKTRCSRWNSLFCFSIN